MAFDYFYGQEDAEQFLFYRIPKTLITGEEFREVSVEAELLYGLMLDRLSLLMKNGWFDDQNRAYTIYTVEDIMSDLQCGNQKAVSDLCSEVFHRQFRSYFRITFQEVCESHTNS